MKETVSHHSLIGCFMFQVLGRCVRTVQMTQSDWLLHVSGMGEVLTHSLTGCFMFQVWGRSGRTVQTQLSSDSSAGDARTRRAPTPTTL